MIIPIKKIILEGIILEISALKARQMSLKAGIIPDHNTNWKGALKKVRGARGELTSGRELSDIKQKIGFPENNVLQKLKSTERKLPTHHEVGYNQLVKTIIPGNDGFVQLTKDSMNHNNNQVGFIHTHPYESKLTKKKFKLNNIDQPSGTVASATAATPMIGGASTQLLVETPVAIDPDQTEPATITPTKP